MTSDARGHGRSKGTASRETIFEETIEFASKVREEYDVPMFVLANCTGCLEAIKLPENGIDI